MNAKRGIATALGAVAALLGAILRMKANALAWPDSYSFSGPRENTTWAMMERAYQDLGVALLVFGLAALLAVLIHWLWSPAAAHRQ